VTLILAVGVPYGTNEQQHEQRKPTMKKFGPSGQRWLKCLHVFFSSLWVGSGLALLAINIFLKADDGMELVGINVTMKFIDDFAIIPAAVGCFCTGLLYSLFTKWGWFRHGWVTAKWIITMFGILSGTFLLGPKLDSLVPTAKTGGLGVLTDAGYVGTKHLLYGFGGLQVASLVLAVFLSILKPWKAKNVD
jgi:hypothetical protein